MENLTHGCLWLSQRARLWIEEGLGFDPHLAPCVNNNFFSVFDDILPHYNSRVETAVAFLKFDSKKGNKIYIFR